MPVGLIEFDNGDADVFTPRMHEEFSSYQLQQMAVYIETTSRGLNKEPKRLALGNRARYRENQKAAIRTAAGLEDKQDRLSLL